MSCIFEHEINILTQIGSHMSLTFFSHRNIVPNFVWVIDQAIQLHLTYSHRYPQDVASASYLFRNLLCFIIFLTNQ